MGLADSGAGVGPWECDIVLSTKVWVFKNDSLYFTFCSEALRGG